MRTVPMTDSDRSRTPDESLIDQAIEWLIRVQDDASGRQEAACRQWRDQHPDHEQAWLCVTGLGKQVRGAMAPVDTHVGIKALEKLPQPGKARRKLMLSLGGGVLLLGAHQVWRSGLVHTLQADYRTATGRRESLTLADGTRLDLNTGTALDVDYDDSLRRVVLHRGEIHVNTGRDARARPFQVETPWGVVQPIGTRFLVRTHVADEQGRPAARVSLLEGMLSLHGRGQGDAPIVLHAGQTAMLGEQGIGTAKPVVGTPDAWLGGMLAVSGMALGEFAAELARYRPGMVSCADDVANLRVSGAFPIDDTDRALRFLAALLPVRIRTMTRYWARIEAA